MFIYDKFSNNCLTFIFPQAPSEQNAVGQDTSTPTFVARIVLERTYQVQKKSVVAVFLRRKQVGTPAVVNIVCPRIAKPVLHGERWISHTNVECLKMRGGLELRIVQRIADLNFGVEYAMQQHVQFCERCRRRVLLLSANAQILARRFAKSAKKERSRATGRIVYRIGSTLELSKVKNHCDDSAHFRRSVELTFRFATFSSKVLHQVFVCVAKQVVVCRSVL